MDFNLVASDCTIHLFFQTCLKLLKATPPNVYSLTQAHI